MVLLTTSLSFAPARSAPRGIGIERLRDPPTEWGRQFDARSVIGPVSAPRRERKFPIQRLAGESRLIT